MFKHVFSRRGALWTHQQELTDPNAAVSDYFGNSVSISPDGVFAVVGCKLDSSARGAAHVYVRSRTSWTHKQEIADPNPNANDEFGYSVAISGDATDGVYIISGARMDNGGGSNTGAAHIFQINPELLGTRIAELERIAAAESGSFIVPSGTTAERPNGVVGMIRYNTTSLKFEGYGNYNWLDLSIADAP